jgi:hypothetical protein
LVRNVPADDVAVVITVPPDALALPPAAAPLAGAAGDAGAAAVLLPALLQAAASRPTPTTPPKLAASLAGFGSRLILDVRIVFPPVRRGRPRRVSLRQSAVGMTTAAGPGRDWRKTTRKA